MPTPPRSLAVSFTHFMFRHFIVHSVQDALDIFIGGTNSRSTLAVLLCALYLYNAIGVMFYAPYLPTYTNVLEAGLNGILAWISVVLVALEFVVGSEQNLSPHAKPITRIMANGIVPAFVVCAGIMWLRRGPLHAVARDAWCGLNIQSITSDRKRLACSAGCSRPSEKPGGSAMSFTRPASSCRCRTAAGTS